MSRDSTGSCCLHCFATIADDDARCEHCGHTSREHDRETYRTVRPGLLVLSRVLQTVAALAGRAARHWKARLITTGPASSASPRPPTMVVGPPVR